MPAKRVLFRSDAREVILRGERPGRCRARYSWVPTSKCRPVFLPSCSGTAPMRLLFNSATVCTSFIYLRPGMEIDG
jgi:hypothetical protein